MEKVGDEKIILSFIIFGQVLVMGNAHWAFPLRVPSGYENK